MQLCLVLLGADAFLADVDILAPAAPVEVDLFPDRPADCACFQHLGYRMPGKTAPSIHYFPLFSYFFEFVVA